MYSDQSLHRRPLTLFSHALILLSVPYVAIPRMKGYDLRDERSDGPLGLISPNVACRRQACATLAYILFALGSSRQNGKGISLFRAGTRMYARRRDSEAARQWLHSLKSL